MLSKEKLEKIEELKGLTPEQITAITELSKNDENVVISDKTKEIYSNLDKDILDITGIARPANTKTYEFNKQVLSEYKTNAEKAKELETKITTLVESNKELEEKAKLGTTDEILKANYEKLNKDYVSLQEKVVNKEKEFTEKETELKSKQHDFFKQLKFNEATKNIDLKFDDEEVKNTMIDAAKNKVLNKYQINFNENGVEEIRTKDDKNEIVLNPTTLKPLGLNDVLKAELTPYLKTPIVGAGSGNPTPNTPVSFGAVKTRAEAMEKIEENLLAKGLIKNSPEYKTALNSEISNEAYSSLPLR